MYYRMSGHRYVCSWLAGLFYQMLAAANTAPTTTHYYLPSTGMTSSDMIMQQEKLYNNARFCHLRKLNYHSLVAILCWFALKTVSRIQTQSAHSSQLTAHTKKLRNNETWSAAITFDRASSLDASICCRLLPIGNIGTHKEIRVTPWFPNDFTRTMQW